LALDEPMTVGDIEGFFSSIGSDGRGPADHPATEPPRQATELDAQLAANVATCLDQLEELGLIEVVS
jgi:hypothetical protein